MEWGIAGLLLSAFLAATVLPLSSEAVLTGLFFSREYDLVLLWWVATLGNVAGSLVNWYLGRYSLRFAHKKWFPLKPDQLRSTQQSYLKWGRWSLLFAWVPIIGDPLTLVAGFFRTPLLFFTLVVFLGKGGRYFVLLWILNTLPLS
jgi:membrane protein YqaA with SNARE-associated domain